MPPLVLAQIIRFSWQRPWLLLSLCALFWAGNAVAGKLAVGEISPMTLTVLRWIGACIVLGAMGRGSILRDLSAARGSIPFLFCLVRLVSPASTPFCIWQPRRPMASIC